MGLSSIGAGLRSRLPHISPAKGGLEAGSLGRRHLHPFAVLGRRTHSGLPAQDVGAYTSCLWMQPSQRKHGNASHAHHCATLLQSGVERSVIALWLGHESVETTQIYLDASLAMKEEALAKTTPLRGNLADINPVTSCWTSSIVCSTRKQCLVIGRTATRRDQ